MADRPVNTLQRDLPRVAPIHRVVEGQVNVLDPGRIEAAVQLIPDQVAEHTAADPPACGCAGAGGAQHPHHPGCRPDDGLKPSHAVVIHGATLPPRADSAAGDLLRPVSNTLREPRTNLRAGPLRLAAAWVGGAKKEADAGLVDVCRPAQLGEPGGKLGRRVVDLDDPVLAAVAKAAPDGRGCLVGQHSFARAFTVAAVKEAGPPAWRQGRTDHRPEGGE